VAARAGLFAMWTDGVDSPAVHADVASMGEYGVGMWSGAGREIERSFAAEPVPAIAFGDFTPSCPILHVYAQPRDPGHLAAQQACAAEPPWFRVHRVGATSHFPCLEVPDEVAAVVDEFVAGLG
jgi:pimeloyl-ACP methyl ester carboxylesterase